MKQSPFLLTKAEEFNHSYELLASLMQFKPGMADVLLSNTNVILEGSRGSGKSMYLRLLSLPVKSTYESLAHKGEVDSLPPHTQFVGVYTKLNPTIFGPNEYEKQPGFQQAFQRIFNIYCIECLVCTIRDALVTNAIQLSETDQRLFVDQINNIIVHRQERIPDINTLFSEIRNVRRTARQAIDTMPLVSDQRSQPDILWQVGELVASLSALTGQRTHFLIDEYDNLSQVQQSIINSYLRKRDFPVTFKVACKKHRLTLIDHLGNPLNSSGDFARLELDDNDFGTSSSYSGYVAAIANKRLKVGGYDIPIDQLLGKGPGKATPGSEIQYGGLKTVTMLSSGIVRTFLELCRDIFSAGQADNGEPSELPIASQDLVIKQHAHNKWSSLARDQSARAELQNLISQIATLFRLKAEMSKEKQIIRLEIIDYDSLSSFLQGLLLQALEYEALVQPNRERLQKNRNTPSRGYLLHRLLCVHFRLEPTSRWDVEISVSQLEELVFGDYDTAKEVSKSPAKRTAGQLAHWESAPLLFQSTYCAIMDEDCPREEAVSGIGFLSCRLPKRGRIRDSINLLKSTFSSQSQASQQFELRTAEDYQSIGDIACKVCGAFSQSSFILVELSRMSPSVAMELGLAISRHKKTFVLFNNNEQAMVPEPFSSLEYFEYSITPDSIENLVQSQLVPHIVSDSSSRSIRLGPSSPPMPGDGAGVFVALPGDDYHQKTILPGLRHRLEDAGLGPVVSEHEGHALQDLQRAARGIAEAKYCLIDTTNGAPTRSMYLGMAQGYGKVFVNLVDEESDPDTRVFTNARSKAEVDYAGLDDLWQRLREIFQRYEVEL